MASKLLEIICWIKYKPTAPIRGKGIEEMSKKHIYYNTWMYKFEKLRFYEIWKICVCGILLYSLFILNYSLQSVVGNFFIRTNKYLGPILVPVNTEQIYTKDHSVLCYCNRWCFSKYSVSNSHYTRNFFSKLLWLDR